MNPAAHPDWSLRHRRAPSWLPLLLVLALAATGFSGAERLVLAADPQNGAMPVNFRSTLAPLPAMPGVNVSGLADTRMIGSGQFSPATLEHAIRGAEGGITIVDLRQESHGFVNDVPVTWAGLYNRGNQGKSDAEAARDEHDRLEELQRGARVTIATSVEKIPGGGLTIKASEQETVRSAYSEAVLAKKKSLGYLRIHVTDGMWPRASEVDRFVSYVRTIPASRWLYFHCRHGRGRTTTFMAAYDMMRNARHVKFEDIVERERRIGGVDLVRLPARGAPAYENARRRLAFLRRFHLYCETNRDGFKTGWSKWLAVHEKR